MEVISSGHSATIPHKSIEGQLTDLSLYINICNFLVFGKVPDTIECWLYVHIRWTLQRETDEYNRAENLLHQLLSSNYFTRVYTIWSSLT